jgi:hypothetical protein
MSSRSIRKRGQFCFEKLRGVFSQIGATTACASSTSRPTRSSAASSTTRQITRSSPCRSTSKTISRHSTAAPRLSSELPSIATLLLPSSKEIPNRTCTCTGANMSTVTGRSRGKGTDRHRHGCTCRLAPHLYVCVCVCIYIYMPRTQGLEAGGARRWLSYIPVLNPPPSTLNPKPQTGTSSERSQTLAFPYSSRSHSNILDSSSLMTSTARF